MKNVDELTNLRFHPRPSEIVEIDIPVDTLSRLRELAAARDMSVAGLLKMYIGQSMRPDAATPSQRFLMTTASVLEQHIASDEQRSAILEDLRGRTVV
ncbi:MAG TPA: hypothetical protein VE913_14345 [Longimicrobium sp.]|nr:hypothetical protein [Longimicrobium sp.]